MCSSLAVEKAPLPLAKVPLINGKGLQRWVPSGFNVSAPFASENPPFDHCAGTHMYQRDESLLLFALLCSSASIIGSIQPLCQTLVEDTQLGPDSLP